MYSAVKLDTIKPIHDRNRAIGQCKKKTGIGMLAAGIASAGGIIAGVGGSTGNWGAAIGGASGLFFGFVGVGSYLYVTGRELVRANSGELSESGGS